MNEKNYEKFHYKQCHCDSIINDDKKMEAVYKEIGQRVDSVRELKNISKQDLAFLANLSQSVVYNLIRGKAEVRLSSLIRVATVIETNINDLLPAELNKYKKTPAVRFLHMCSNLDANQMECLFDIIQKYVDSINYATSKKREEV